ncbi:MAG: glycosyltransferase [Myxococcota bacterium]
MTSAAIAIFACALIGLGIIAASLVATYLHRGHAPERGALVPVSLLKPLKGLEDGLEANLRSFFELDYGAPFELVFCCADPDDPALALARELATQYEAPVRFVITDERFGLNPKVANLAGALPHARYDLIHQSDANVRVEPDYLTNIVGELRGAGASMLSSVVVGRGEETFGAALENLQLSAYIGPATCLALKANIVCVCGKSMLFYRSELEEDFGGLASVKDVLCEDFVLGERYKAAGRTVCLSATTVSNVNVDCGAERFLERHGRWLKMRATLHVPGFLVDLLANPIALALLGLIVSGFHAYGGMAFLAICVAKTLLDRRLVASLRQPMAPRFVWLTLAKDLLLLPLWIQAVFSRRVTWRGRPLHFRRHTELLPLEPEAEPESHEPAIAAE